MMAGAFGAVFFIPVVLEPHSLQLLASTAI